MTSPTVKRRRLSHVLRQLRQSADLTATEAAKRLEWDPSKVARMERNQWKLPNVHDIRLLLDLYGVTDGRQREVLITLARESRQRGWWANYEDVFRSSLPDFEAGASVIRTYEALLIPGLLQTAAYAAAIWRAGQVLDEHTDHVIERHVQARLARQQVLTRESPPQLLTVIDEAALIKVVGGPTVMREQLHHLIRMAASANVTIQVLPNSSGAHAAMTGGFAIMDFSSPADDPSLVYMETATENLWLETPEKHQQYALIFSRVQASALSPEESVTCLSTHMDGYGR
ncbi:transcriptional regulator [Sphaerisporangium siamense]|uniref:Transcriptional regulator with XRE-family HTH domain n=2 Tax=Sphaerisporangium siamense TaxID=795645 RepID=A0A7W7G7N3_9ACTN|nr:helix-turn-helix transcriptional regulator [Sphaerisporangium siamense]MBB4700808.1 transcriptional regulator with XRE-family HTH domain [Sphaerisporangium siamense]GII86046.1 transcriptional regulator [Sphaerisporangium siamense]